MKILRFLFFGKISTEDPEPSFLTRIILELRYIVLLFGVTFFIVQPFVIASYETPTCSMEPTIMTNTRYFALPSAYGGFFRFTKIKLPGYKKIHRGDIVIFKYPKDESVNYVKRVIGLPGECVTIRENTVYINNQPLNEPYAHYNEQTFESQGITYGPAIVPPNHLFVMGDNRDNSYDSRYWGFLPVRNVFGTPLFAFWSYDQDRHGIRFKEIFKSIK